MRKTARRNIGALPKHLPRCEQVLEPEATACSCCQGQLHKIGEDVSEVPDIIPAILRVLRTIRPKYGCRSCTDCVVQVRICQFWAHAMDDRPWGGPSPPAVAYVLAEGRGTEEIAGQLKGFSDILQVDGYAAYTALARGHGDAIQLAFCLAHAGRTFVEVYKTMQSPFAREVIERLQAVYAIEAQIRGISAEQRFAVWRTRSAPLMAALKARWTEMVGQLFLHSKLAEAINYALNHWDG